MFHAPNDLVQSAEKYEDGHYIGTVVSNQDPEGIGRIQANVPGLYDSSLGPIPWIGPDKDSPFGFGTNTKGAYGVYGSPQEGSIVRVILQNGDEHKPLYRPLLTVPNANSTFASPTVWGFSDPDGNIVIYDMSAHTYRFVTAGGAVITIDTNANRVTTVGNDTTNTKNWTVNVTGNASISASGNASVQASSNVTVQAGGTATYTAALHKFNGPIQANETISAGGDITDDTNSGNGQTMADMRVIYNEHTHTGTDSHGDSFTTNPPQPQIP